MRKNLFKWHSYSALLTLIPLIIIAVTGSILVFKTEIDTWLMPERMTVAQSSNQQRANFNQLVAHVEQTHQNYLVGSWEIFDDKKRSDTVYLISKTDGQWSKMYIDQYQNKLLSNPVSVTHDITDWLLSLHYTFLLGTTGAFLGLIFAIVLLFLGVSGIILHRQFWRKLFTLRFGAARRIFYSDVHKFIGIVSSPIIIVLAITGGYWNTAEVLHEVEHHLEQDQMVLQDKLYSSDIDLQALLDNSTSAIDGFTPTYFVFPFEPELHFTVYGDVTGTNILTSQYSSTIGWNRDTGQLTTTFDIRQAALGWVILDSFRKLHFGYFAGLPSKVIWCVLGLSPLWLSLTGLYFYLFRKRKYLQKYASAPVIS